MSGWESGVFHIAGRHCRTVSENKLRFVGRQTEKIGGWPADPLSQVKLRGAQLCRSAMPAEPMAEKEVLTGVLPASPLTEPATWTQFRPEALAW
jgi:hypothetical protein